MAINPHVVAPQVQHTVQAPLPADNPALFGAELLIIGFNAATIQLLGTHGMDIATRFHSIPLSQFDTMMKNINQPVTFPPVDQGLPGVKFPYVAVMGLKGFRAWFDYLAAGGQALDPSADPNLVFQVWIKRLDDLARFDKSKDSKTLIDVPKFASLKEWKDWDDLMRTALCGVSKFYHWCTMLILGSTPHFTGTSDVFDDLEYD
jgi:hypothetical protein